jgi:hypothetical protein
MIEHFGSHTFKINAHLLSGAYPIISELYGPTQELEMEFKIKRPTVSFGIADNDVGFEFEFDFGIKLAGDMNFLIYDEMKLRFEGDLVFDQEVLFGELSTITIEQTGQNKGQRTLPVFNSLSMAEDNYVRFWQWARNFVEVGKRYLNVDILSYGVKMPYWHLQLLTQTMFK